jgi:hypothetical protein
MKEIATTGYQRPKSVAAGATPRLQWLLISDLVLDSVYHRPIVGSRRKVDRIARSFSWSRFAPVVVAPVPSGKFVIIDGQHRTTAAAVAGFDKVPCQIVEADREEQAIAFKAINRTATASSRMALQAASYSASEPRAIQLAELCACAEVELLRYPVPIGRQRTGQTMAVGAISQCLKRYGEETLITALQCVTRTTNNRPGVLSARIIKALCAVLGSDPALRESGLTLLETFDAIDLAALANQAAADAAVRDISPVQLLIDRIRSEVAPKLVRKTASVNSVGRMVEASGERRLAFPQRNNRSARTKAGRQPRKS